MTVPKELILFKKQLERVVAGEENKLALHYEGKYEKEWTDRRIHSIWDENESPAEVLEQVKKLIMWTKVK